MRNIFILSAFLVLAPLATACHGTASEYCDEKCDCEDCSANEYDACIVDREAADDVSSSYGCDAFFLDYHDCVVAHNSCVLDNFVPDDLPGTDCANEKADLADCVSDNSAIF